MAPRELASQSGRASFLLSVENSLRQGNACTLLGRRKFGKTFLAQQLGERLSPEFLVVLADLERMALTPEHFSLGIMGKTLAAATQAKPEDAPHFREMGFLLSLEKEMGKTAYGLLKAAENELQKIKPDQRLLVENAWWFCMAVAVHLKKKALIILDNAEHLAELNNFSQIGDVFSLLPQKESDISFLFASSAASEMKQHSSFEHFAIPPLDEKEVEAMVRSIAPKTDRKSIESIMRLSAGHPFVARVLAKHALDFSSPEEGFAAELLGKEGALHRYGEEALHYYYSMARGQTLIKLLLNVVAREELRLSEIARKIYRSAPLTKSILERLMAVDAIEKRGKVFVVSDPVLGLWLRMAGGDWDCGEIDGKKLQDFSREIGRAMKDRGGK